MTWKTTDTRQRLLDAGRIEFVRYGFADASLRRIAAAVGIAAPSVYNHFAGKEEMFSALVEPIICKVKDTFLSVDGEKRELALARRGDELLNREQVMGAVLDFVYENLEDVKLLLFCAAGTRYEGILDKAARMEADATLRVMREAGYPGFSPEEQETIFLIMRHQYQTYAEALRRNYDKQRTRTYWETVSRFFTVGWKQFLRVLNEDG